MTDVGYDLLIAVRDTASDKADRLDAEADKLAGKVAELRYRALALRMLHDTAHRMHEGGQ